MACQDYTQQQQSSSLEANKTLTTNTWLASNAARSHSLVLMILGNYYRLLNKINRRGKEWGIEELRGCFRTSSNVGSWDARAPLHVFPQRNLKKKPDLLLHPSATVQRAGLYAWTVLETYGPFYEFPKTSQHTWVTEVSTSASVQLISLYLCMYSAECPPWSPGDRRGHLHGHDECISSETNLKCKATFHFSDCVCALDQNSLKQTDSFEVHTRKCEETQSCRPAAPKPPSSFTLHRWTTLIFLRPINWLLVSH